MSFHKTVESQRGQCSRRHQSALQKQTNKQKQPHWWSSRWILHVAHYETQHPPPEDPAPKHMQRCQGINLPLALLMLTICWKAQGLAFSCGASACFMPALAALAQDLALKPTPSAPATAICTASREGLAIYPFHMHVVLSDPCHLKCDEEGGLNRTVLFFFSIAAAESTRLCCQRINSIISLLKWMRASSMYHICTFIQQGRKKEQSDSNGNIYDGVIWLAMYSSRKRVRVWIMTICTVKSDSLPFAQCLCSAPAASADGPLCNSLCHCTIIPSLPKHFPHWVIPLRKCVCAAPLQSHSLITPTPRAATFACLHLLACGS